MKNLVTVLLISSLSTQIFGQQREIWDFNQWNTFLTSVDGRQRSPEEVNRAMNFYNTHYDENGKPITRKSRKRMVEVLPKLNEGEPSPTTMAVSKPIERETPKPLIKVPIPSEINDGVYVGKVKNGMRVERLVNLRMYDVNEIMESPQFQHFMGSWNETGYAEHWSELKNKNPFQHFLDTKLLDVYIYLGIMGGLKNPESLEFVDGSEFVLMYNKENMELTLHIPYKAQNGYGNYVVGKTYLIEDSNGKSKLL